MTFVPFLDSYEPTNVSILCSVNVTPPNQAFVWLLAKTGRKQRTLRKEFLQKKGENIGNVGFNDSK